MAQFLSVIFFVGFLQFVLGFLKFPFFVSPCIYFLFISSSTCFGQLCPHPQEVTTQWLHRCVWCSAVAAVGCQNRLAGCVSIEEYVARSQLLRMGTKLPETC